MTELDEKALWELIDRLQEKVSKLESEVVDLRHTLNTFMRYGEVLE